MSVNFQWCGYKREYLAIRVISQGKELRCVVNPRKFPAGKVDFARAVAERLVRMLA